MSALALGLGLPLLLSVTVNFLRPDLIALMLNHEFGLTLVLFVQFLCFVATSLYSVAALVEFRSRVPRVLLILAALLFTLTALLGILFGPIVFAFMQTK